MDINELLAFSRKNKASDLHLTVASPPMLRINGDIIQLRVNPLTNDDIIQMLYSIMSEKQRVEYEKELELDFAIELSNEGRFRVNAFNTVNGAAAALRAIPSDIMTLEQLKLPPVLETLLDRTKGLILVTGPTGSGKSTTLAAMIDHINQYSNKHILTIEDPVEFIHKPKNSLINQREVGTSTNSFKRALKSALREDPDIILVGEMRDLETISLALTAAETGHLVFGTLHTSSASKTIDRIIDAFSEGDKPMARTMLAGSLEAIITQLLVKVSDGSGRLAVNEILIASPAVRNLIRDSQIPQIYSMMQVSSKHGMQVMKDSVYRLLEEDLITRDTARQALNQTLGEADKESAGTTREKGVF
ncbi:MAG: type IV pilus twitching motility protein PilT [Rickettsiales bacterium]|nr:type IV pilus twitching motility protein PilT [Pseudomonadota bacterium]MDA0967190.1 type IV pilus twitching motility protein PilT [Pseudomonadota bacterium]MDG4544150.1 type IV pilus twitching motility protein PilT [Rickettsiales bacterium]MDG4546331.1 type IV pilus twitching motility protein PilT [Rickettsiales bacterium]MDG4548474.1 type IV pilus twitching motility protein PilT [Rickettsiales bacterium]